MWYNIIIRLIMTNNKNNRYSTSYVGTFDHRDSNDLDIIANLRKALKGTNQRLCLKGRLGKNNPNRDYYKASDPWHWRATRGYQTILLKHAERVDAYIYSK